MEKIIDAEKFKLNLMSWQQATASIYEGQQPGRLIIDIIDLVIMQVDMMAQTPDQMKRSTSNDSEE